MYHELPLGFYRIELSTLKCSSSTIYECCMIICQGLGLYKFLCICIICIDGGLLSQCIGRYKIEPEAELVDSESIHTLLINGRAMEHCVEK